MPTRRTFARLFGATVLGSALAGCTGSDGSADDPTTPPPTTTRPTTDRTTTRTTTPSTATTTENRGPTLESLATDLAGVPAVTDENRDHRSSATAEVRDPDGIRRIDWYLNPEGGPGHVGTSEPDSEGDRATASVAFPSRLLAPGENTLELEVTDGRGVVETRSATLELAFPYRIDWKTPEGEDHGSYNTRRGWDQVRTLSEQQVSEYYWNDIQYESSLSSVPKWMKVRDEVEESLNEINSDVHWVRGLVKGVANGLDEKSSISGSGGFVKPLVAGVKKYHRDLLIPEADVEAVLDERYTEAERQQTDLTAERRAIRAELSRRRMITWEVNATNEDHPNHEQGVLVDREEDQAWLYEPFIDQLEYASEVTRRIENTRYADPEDTQHALGLDYQKYRSQAEQERIENEWVHGGVVGGLRSLVDSSMNDVSNFPDYLVSKKFGRQLSQLARNIDVDVLQLLEEDAMKVQKMAQELNENDCLLLDGEVGNGTIYTGLSGGQVERIINFDYDSIDEVIDTNGNGVIDVST